MAPLAWCHVQVEAVDFRALVLMMVLLNKP